MIFSVVGSPLRYIQFVNQKKPVVERLARLRKYSLHDSDDDDFRYGRIPAVPPELEMKQSFENVDQAFFAELTSVINTYGLDFEAVLGLMEHRHGVTVEDIQNILKEGGASPQDLLISQQDYQIMQMGEDELVAMADQFSIADTVTIENGIWDTPKVTLHHGNGSKLEIHCWGATVTSWTTPQHGELIFTYPQQRNNLQGPIRGGIQVCVPNVLSGNDGLPPHGIVSDELWELVQTGVEDPMWLPEPFAKFRLTSDIFNIRRWSYLYEITLKISILESPSFKDYEAIELRKALGPDFLQSQEGKHVKQTPAGWTVADSSDRAPYILRYKLYIENKDTRPFSYNYGILTHFLVRNLNISEEVAIKGLMGKSYIDRGFGNKDKFLCREDEEYVKFTTFPGYKIDRVYNFWHEQGESADMFFCPGDRTHYAFETRGGYEDIYVFNPGQDNEPIYSNYFVGIGAGRMQRPQLLFPGDKICAEFHIKQYDTYWPSTPMEDGPLPSELDKIQGVNKDTGDLFGK